MLLVSPSACPVLLAGYTAQQRRGMLHRSVVVWRASPLRYLFPGSRGFPLPDKVGM